MTVHPWERRQAEREAQAAADNVERLERALAANAEEYECRLEQLAAVRAATAANHAKMETASSAGVRIVHDGSRREAEPLFPEVPMSAVAMMEAAIADGERLAGEESRLLAAVTSLERQRDQIIRTLERSRPVAAGLRDVLATLDTPTDFPTGSAPAVGTAEIEVEPAEAAMVGGSGPDPVTSSSPTSVSARLAAIGKRIGQW